MAIIISLLYQSGRTTYVTLTLGYISNSGEEVEAKVKLAVVSIAITPHIKSRIIIVNVDRDTKLVASKQFDPETKIGHLWIHLRISLFLP